MRRLILMLLFVSTAAAGPREGVASWYGFDHQGRQTANGERFDAMALTAASWHYPFGTKLKVTCVDSGKSVIVRVNDRGPAKRLKREIDLSAAAFSAIADRATGLTNVKVEVVK